MMRRVSSNCRGEKKTFTGGEYALKVLCFESSLVDWWPSSDTNVIQGDWSSLSRPQAKEFVGKDGDFDTS